MNDVFLCRPLRSPVGRFGGALASVRPDDLAARLFEAVLAQHPQVDPEAIDDVILGCANQAGEDNRSVARMAARAWMPSARRRGRSGLAKPT